MENELAIIIPFLLDFRRYMKDTNISTLSSVDTKTIQNMKMPVELALFESDIMLSDSRDRKMILNQDKS